VPKLQKFLAQVEAWQAFAQEHKPSELLERILRDTSYIESLGDPNSLEVIGRKENLEELASSILTMEKSRETLTLTDYLENVSLVSVTDDLDPNEAAVSLMTLHAAKGLEYKVVFMVGVEESLFPNHRAAVDRGNYEEERRLFYVGITRARQFLIISRAANRMYYGELRTNDESRFMHEMPAEILRPLNPYDPAFHDTPEEAPMDVGISMPAPAAGLGGAYNNYRSRPFDRTPFGRGPQPQQQFSRQSSPAAARRRALWRHPPPAAADLSLARAFDTCCSARALSLASVAMAADCNILSRWKMAQNTTCWPDMPGLRQSVTKPAVRRMWLWVGAVALAALMLAGCGVYVPKGATVIVVKNTKLEFDHATLRATGNELVKQGTIRMSWYDTNTFLTTATLTPGTYKFLARNYEGAGLSRDIIIQPDKNLYEIQADVAAGPAESGALAATEGPPVSGNLVGLHSGKVAVLFISADVIMKTSMVKQDGSFSVESPRGGPWKIEVHLLGRQPKSWSSPQMMATDKPQNLGQVLLK